VEPYAVSARSFTSFGSGYFAIRSHKSVFGALDSKF
jgi:hypothetical protein